MHLASQSGIAAPILINHHHDKQPGIDALSQVSRVQHIEQSIMMILSTRPGTRPLERDYGCRIYELLFKPITPSIIARLRFFIEQSIRRWEPERVNLHSVDVDFDRRLSRLGELRVRIVWSDKANPMPLRNIEFSTLDGEVQLDVRKA